jgi:DNA modification methylase
VVIYCGDCREILTLIPDKSIDLVLTDPPYPNQKGELVIGNYKTVGDLWDSSLGWISLAWQKVSQGMMIFCGTPSVPQMAKAIPVEGYKGLISWCKPNCPNSVRNVPKYNVEYIWLLSKSNDLLWRKLTCYKEMPTLGGGYNASEKVVNHFGETQHPTQKPSSLILWLLNIGGNLILDPFLGSGTTAVCAKKLGRKCIGVEVSENYCRIAVERLRQSVMKLE